MSMAWLVVDSDRHEYVYATRPIKRELYGGGIGYDSGNSFYVRLPKGSIKKLIGKELTWNDEPVKLE